MEYGAPQIHDVSHIVFSWMFSHEHCEAVVYYGFDSEAEPWPKGLVFLETLRECLRGSLRSAYAPMVLAYAQAWLMHAYADAYAGLRTTGFCLREVLIAAS